ncbi:MAG: hypothetical protein HC933_11595, partial [Pleurocapsa sp. SU_196_0]|nr:hypothetical protein [Pleurocapsa sp. SU_196_0]
MAQAATPTSARNPGFWASIHTFPLEVKRNLVVLFASQAFASGATVVSTTLG